MTVLFLGPGPNLWNCLPLHVQSAPTIKCFKSRLKTPFVCHCYFLIVFVSFVNFHAFYYIRALLVVFKLSHINKINWLGWVLNQMASIIPRKVCSFCQLTDFVLLSCFYLLNCSPPVCIFLASLFLLELFLDLIPTTLCFMCFQLWGQIIWLQSAVLIPFENGV